MKKAITLYLYLFCVSIFSQSFSGGIGDGFVLGAYININSPNIFSGGISDGFALITYSNTVSPKIFTGGDGDGFSLITYKNIISPNIFSGGDGDGFILKTYLNIISPNIFAGGIGDGFDVGIYLGDTLEVNETLFKTTYIIYPNPTSHYINLSFSRNISNYQVIIYDVFGKTMLNTSNRSSINVSNFSTGNYIVQIIDNDSNVKITKKLIIK